MGRLSLKFLDYQGQRSDMGVYTPDLTAVNIDAQLALMDTLVAAVEAVTLGTKVRDQRVAQLDEFAATLPASDDAHRQLKWLVSMSDNVLGQSVTFTIPTADTQFLVAGTGSMDIVGAGAGLDLKNAIEAVVQSQFGNAVTVLSVRLVGRVL